MMMRWFLLSLLLLIGQSANVSAEPAAAQQEISELQAQVAKTPDNADLQLKLAFRLSWQERLDEARIHALEVIRLAPEYWDAHILLARLDAWQGNYLAAQVRLELVLEAAPQNRDALLCRADVGLWSRDFGDARAAIEQLIEIKPSADLYFRLAQISFEEMDPILVRRHTASALALDPNHKPSKQMREQAHFVQLYFTSQTEYFPQVQGQGRQAFGQTLVLSVLPRASLGLAFTYDYHWRFASSNHRIGTRINLRATNKLLLSTFVRIGRTEVLPDLSADIGGVYRLTSKVAVGAKYNWDRMTWPGRLHRVTASVSSQVQKSTLLKAAYFGGVMRHCGESGFVQGVALESEWRREFFQLGTRYSFGTELERPPLAGYLQGRLGEDFCLGDLGEELQGSPLDLAETKAHDLGVSARLELGASTVVLGGYGIALRFDDSEVHLFYLTLRLSL